MIFVNTKISRVISNILTFPGLLFSPLIMNFTAYAVDLEVTKVNYLALDDSPTVTHEIPKTYNQAFVITFIPFIVISLCAIYILIYTNQCLRTPIGKLTDWGLFYMWFAFSLAAHSFPFTVNGDEFGVQSMRLFREGNYLAALGIPLVYAILFLEASKVMFSNIVYGILLIILVFDGWLY